LIVLGLIFNKTTDKKLIVCYLKMNEVLRKLYGNVTM